MKHYQKVVACVLKDLGHQPKILAFEHPPPLSDFQIPKGTVEKNEILEKAVLRELAEESGITEVQVKAKIGSFEVICPGGPDGDLELERQTWHLYHIDSSQNYQNSWKHMVTGEGIDFGLVYRYFWHEIDGSLSRFHPKFHQLFSTLKAYLENQNQNQNQNFYPT